MRCDRHTTRQDNTNDGGSSRAQGLLSAFIDINLYLLSSTCLSVPAGLAYIMITLIELYVFVVRDTQNR